jgi:hypothetical protein
MWEDLAAIAADPTSEELGFRLASLRWFLRLYRCLRPEVVTELMSRAFPAFRDAFINRWEESRREGLQKALRDWIDEFGLPRSSEMKAEAILTLMLAPSPSGRLVFAWDCTKEILEAHRKANFLPAAIYPLPFPFQATRWAPARESIEEATRRLRSEFERTLLDQRMLWYKEQKSGANLYALWERDKDHFRNIRWLAYKQALPNLSEKEIAKRCRCSLDTVRRGLRSAADCLGLPRESIRQARRGRKPRSLSV